ncbi:hypothetical protein CPG37_04485 [Malaciobacter canalis]|uniref:Uncharacterized protein n=1 Tax=Malaciobacter canalis TaxID=1912871 RepID=A0ABX4LQW3_9BACT|nr:hypothetical protein [Malaciobacter canalis]PHO10309.1 hypothetical protein CPG37_04485 [Malaciobacter canalis]QEE32414.1 hypothetical protein ACAN_0925 [Malaciobacter canalis]
MDINQASIEEQKLQTQQTEKLQDIALELTKAISPANNNISVTNHLERDAKRIAAAYNTILEKIKKQDQ